WTAENDFTRPLMRKLGHVMKIRLHTTLAATAVIAAAAVASAGSAQADGMAAKAAPAAPSFSWTGFYTGVSAGRSRQDFGWTFPPGIPGGVHQAFDVERQQAMWGGIIGYNYQSGPWVVGLEVAWDRIGLTNSWARDGAFGNNTDFQAQAKLDNVIT